MSKISDWIQRLLSKSAAPTSPAPSVFGPEATRQAERKKLDQEMEMEIERNRNRPRGM